MQEMAGWEDMSSDHDHDKSENDHEKSDEECRYFEEEGDCKALAQEEGQNIEGLAWCNYTLKEDTCEGWYECHAEMKFNDEIYHGTCDEMQEIAGWEDMSTQDDDCDIVQEQGDCKELARAEGFDVSEMEYCEYTSIWNPCTDESECWA